MNEELEGNGGGSDASTDWLANHLPKADVTGTSLELLLAADADGEQTGGCVGEGSVGKPLAKVTRVARRLHWTCR